MTTRKPFRLVPLGPSYNCDTGYGYDVKINYKVQDQLLTDMTLPIGENEDWTTLPVPDYVGTDWERGAIRNAVTSPGSQFWDEIQGERIDRIPTAFCLGVRAGKVQHWGQMFKVGSTVTGSGTQVQVNVLQKYQNDAAHE